MKFKPSFLFSTFTAAAVFTASALLLNACRKDAKDSSMLQTTGRSAVATSAAMQFNAEMKAMAKKSLVAWYSFEGGSLKDRSKHNNDIVFSNATPAADRYGNAGNAYRFDGKSSYMQIKNSRSLNPTQEITLFAIVQVDGFYAGSCHGNRILCKGNDDFINGHYYLGFDDSYHTSGMNCSQPVRQKLENFNAVYGYAGGGKSAGAYDTGYVYKDRWYRLAFTYSNGITKLYVNGRLMSYTEQSPVFRDNGQDLYIGRMGNAQYPYWFNGIIDEVAVFNKALSDEEAAALSNM